MSVVREINFYLNSRERNPPSVQGNPATISTWSLDVPITLRSPGNYFQISVRGFYADPGLVRTYETTTWDPTNGHIDGQHWINVFPSEPYIPINPTAIPCTLPRGNYTNQSLVDWMNDVVVPMLRVPPPNNVFATLDNRGYCRFNQGENTNIGSPPVPVLCVDFSVTLWRAFGFGSSYYGITQADEGGFAQEPYDTRLLLPINTIVTPPFPMQTQPNRTLFVLFNGGVMDSFSTTTCESETYLAIPHVYSYQQPWALGQSGGFKERRCIGAVSLLSGSAGDKIDYTATNFVYSQLSSPVISSISLELATENFKVVPIDGAEYTIVLGVQECVPIAQTQPGIPQPIVLPKKGDEKDKKGGDGSEEYIRQLAQQIKQRRLQRAADMVDKSE